MKKWLFNLLESLLPQKRAGEVVAKPLMKPRPSSLEQNYLLAADGPLPDEAFTRLRNELFRAVNGSEQMSLGGRTVFKEAGRLPGGRPYFFLQPANDRGFLFERSGSGWVISRAEKIVERGLFMRDYEVIDQVNLFYARDGRTYPRVKSAGPKATLVSFSVYEQQVKQSLGLTDGMRRL